MKLIIKMEMPRHCNECACFYGGICFAIKDPNIDGVLPKDTLIDRPSWCPICGVLPEEHGDLIDRDKPMKDIQLWKSTATDTITMGFLYHFEKLLMCTRPIVEAERKDDENH